MGTETNLLGFLDINDIESIEVLKDFAASAKYGPNAANGIINITTKAPRVGQMRVSVNAYAGVSLKPTVDAVNGRYESNFPPALLPEICDETQWRNFPVTGRFFPGPLLAPRQLDDPFLRNAFTEGIQAAVSGGAPYANFRFSIGQSSQQGVYDKTGIKLYDVNFRINIQPIRNLILQQIFP